GACPLGARVVEQPGHPVSARSARRDPATDVAHRDDDLLVPAQALDFAGGGFGNHDKLGAVEDEPNRSGNRGAVLAVRGEADVPATADLVDQGHPPSVAVATTVP